MSEATPTSNAGPIADLVADLDTPRGPGRLHVFGADVASGLRAVLLSSHGAGGGVEARDLTALARRLPPVGVAVVLLEQPWRVAGRKIATAPPTLDEALLSAVGALGRLGLGEAPLILGGRSAGARSACRSAERAGAVAVLAQSFPLHPPGKPERSRAAELAGAGVPTLVIQGERDSMGRPEEFGPALAPEPRPDVRIVVVPGADHALKVPKRGPLSELEAMELLASAAVDWITVDLLGNQIG